MITSVGHKVVSHLFLCKTPVTLDAEQKVPLATSKILLAGWKRPPKLRSHKKKLNQKNKSCYGYYVPVSLMILKLLHYLFRLSQPLQV